MKVVFKILLLCTLLLLTSVTANYANTWNLDFNGNFNLALSSYSSSWTGEERGTINWLFDSDFTAEKQLSQILTNKNTLNLSFGQSNIQDPETMEWSVPRKTTDLIDMESVFRFTLETFIDPYVSGKVQSQFIDSLDNLMNPVTFSEGVGTAKLIFEDKNKSWIVRVGGGVRQYLDRAYPNSDEGGTSVKTQHDGGIELVSEITLPLADEQIRYKGDITAYKALYYSKSDELKGTEREDNWKAIDINWKNRFSADLIKYVTVNLYIQLLYDKETEKKVRYKNTLSLGLTYSFSHPKE